MADLFLVVNGARYTGWKQIRVTRSIESMCGSFALDVSDRWGAGSVTWPIIEGDPCRVELDGEVVIDGYVDDRELDTTATSRALSYTGRDRAADLVDCSAVLDRWTFRNLTLADFVRALAEPFDVKVTVQTGLALERKSKIVVQPGDKVYDVIMRETAEAGVLLVSDGAGGLVMTRAGATRAAGLVEGVNVIAARSKFSAAERFRRYVVVTQAAGTDEAYGDATRIQAEATDLAVRASRVLLIRPDKGGSVDDARRRADWEARIRAARADSVSVTVRGWRQPDGEIWPVNAIAPVKCPRSAGVDGDMLISQVDYAIDREGTLSVIRLVRPDAFTPEPTKATVKTSGELWKELNNGGLL